MASFPSSNRTGAVRPPPRVNFDTPTPPGGPGPLDGVFEGIAFGTGQWAWEGPYGVDSTNNIYFAAAGWQRLRESAPEVWSVGEPN